MVARTVIAVGVGLIAATTWAAEPLRFVTEPESAAMPVQSDPAASSAARQIAPEASASNDSDDTEATPVRVSSRRRWQASPPPAPPAADDREPPADQEPATQEEPAVGEPLPPPSVLPSAHKPKVVTVVRPKNQSAVAPSRLGDESREARPIEEPAAPAMAGKPAPKTRRMASAGRPLAPSVAQTAPVGADRSNFPSHPKHARKAARIAVTPEQQPVGNYPKPARVENRHLLSPPNAASEAAADEVAATTPQPSDARPTRRRRAPAAEAKQESDPLSIAERQPAPLADDGSTTRRRQTSTADGQSAQESASFRFQLSEDGATSVALEEKDADGPPLEAGENAALTAEPAVGFHAGEESPAAEPVLADSPPRQPASSRRTAALYQAPLATRLDALHPKRARPVPKPAPAEIASGQGDTSGEAASSDSEGSPAESQPVMQVAQAAVLQSTAQPLRAAKGSVVHFDRTHQTVRLIFGGVEPPPVGSMIRVQHTSVFGANEYLMLRVVRVEAGEVLARAPNNMRLQRLSRGDTAFYRPAAAAPSSERQSSVARAPMTARETVWK